MAFKPSPDKKVRLESLGKKALVATVKTLQRRERALLNQVAKLEQQQNAMAHELRVRVPSGASFAQAVTLCEDGPAANQSAGPFPWEQSK